MVKRLDDLPHIFVDLDAIGRRSDIDMPARMAADGVAGLRGSHARLLELLTAAFGVRPSALAETAGISKQAVGERLRELVQRELVESAPDPTDGRALLVRLTPTGERARDSIRRAIAGMEQAWAEQVGAERYAEFRAVLAELAQAHRRQPAPEVRTSVGTSD